MSPPFYHKMVDALVEKLQKANWAYRNTDTLLMSDEEYDRDLEKLRALSPAHPFLSLIGAKPPSGVKEVVLPVTMGSLDKVIYGEGGLDRWKKRMAKGTNAAKSFVITEKLDGISAMFVIRGSKKHLYLRGDGVRGVDVSLIIGALGLGSLRGDLMVRGEIVLPVAATPPGSIGRSLINGWVHRSSSAAPAAEAEAEAVPELSAAHFVGYQVLEPAGMTRRQQSEWLSANGFRRPWTRVIAEPGLKEDPLRDILVTRRAASEYPLDGIVIGADCVPVAIGGGEAKNPADCIAFKAALDEQKETTTVIQVEWNASRQGCLIPRIQVAPVTIGGANIQWLSGHNAAMIYKNKIGPGARIVVRRSGDVIPTLDSVLSANEPSMPSVKWAWDAGNTHAMVSAGEATNTVPMLHALQTLGVENIGPGLVDKLGEAGLTRMRQLWDASAERLSEAIGAGRGPALHKNLRECVAKAGQLKLLIASNLLPRGVGERKLRLLYAKEADARRWRQEDMADVGGWSEETLSELFKTLPAALAWPSEQFGVGAGTSGVAVSLVPAASVSLVPPPSKFVVFTGVRDKVLEENIRPHGWAVEPAVTKKTTVLVVADAAHEDAAESVKVKKARAAGIRIMRISDFRTFATV
jgi:NAD-dependent DNA ligase